MPKCKIHPDTELVCPKCFAASGGKAAAETSTHAERVRRARKAITTRWKGTSAAERSAAASKAAAKRWAGTTKAERQRFAKDVLVASRAAKQEERKPQ